MGRVWKNTTIIIALSLVMAALIPVLADQSGPRSESSGSVYAEETASRVVYGANFYAWVTGLFDDYDPEGTEYQWEVAEGSIGEVAEAAITTNNWGEKDFSFRATKPGRITIQFKAVEGESVLKTVTKSFDIVYPYETYSCYCSSITESDGDGFTGGQGDFYDELKYYSLDPGSSFTLVVHNWYTGEGRSFASETVPVPTIEDFEWEQSGEGSVKIKEASGTSGNGYTFTFECVDAGDMVLTLKAKDGWSESFSFRVHPYSGDIPYIGFWRGTTDRLKTSYDGNNIIFNLQDDYGEPYKIKGVKCGQTKSLDGIVYAVSSDESIAIPGTCFWNKPWEFESGDEIQGDLPMRIFKAGTIKITFKDAKYNEPLRTVEVKITDAVVEKIKKNWKERAYKSTLQYGETTLKAYSGEGDTITINYAGVEQTKTEPAIETVAFNDLPVMKTGTTGTVTFKRFGDGLTVTKNFTVKDTKCYLAVSKVKTSQDKVTVKAGYAKAGDVIKIKAGGKTYTKKVKANTSCFKFTQKIKKQKKGAKIKVTVYNKFKQVRIKRTVKVSK